MVDLATSETEQIPEPPESKSEVVRTTVFESVTKHGSITETKERAKDEEKKYSAATILGIATDRLVKQIIKQRLSDRRSPDGIPVPLSEEVALSIEFSELLGDDLPANEYFDRVKRILPDHYPILARNLRNGATAISAEVFIETGRDDYELDGYVSDASFISKLKSSRELQAFKDSAEVAQFGKQYGFANADELIAHLINNVGLVINEKQIFTLTDPFLPPEQQPELFNHLSPMLKQMFAQLSTMARFEGEIDGEKHETSSSATANPDFMTFEALEDNEEDKKFIQEITEDFRHSLHNIQLLSPEVIDRMKRLMEKLQPDPVTGKPAIRMKIFELKLVSSITKKFDLKYTVDTDLIHTLIAVNLFFRGIQIATGQQISHDLIHTIPYEAYVINAHMPVVNTHASSRKDPLGGLEPRNEPMTVHPTHIDTNDLDAAFTKYTAYEMIKNALIKAKKIKNRNEAKVLQELAA